MGYLHIKNLYKDRAILEFKQVYALEKIHGTSAHIRMKDDKLSFFSGGVKSHEQFCALFDHEALAEKMRGTDVVIYGEAYGGKLMKMSKVYGADLRFVAFDVMINGRWLGVPEADAYVVGLGLEFVAWELIPSDDIDKAREKPSAQAQRNGIGDDCETEGVVLRPPFECTNVYGERIIVKHKREKFRETTGPRELSATELQVLEDADQIAEEWVTEMRLTHVLDKLGPDLAVQDTGRVVAAMVEDVLREGEGEIVVTRQAKSAIGRRAAGLFKNRVG